MADRQITRLTFLLQLVLILVLKIHVTGAIWLDNVDCGSYPDVVATDPGSFRYQPIYVSLNRCKGASVNGIHHLMSCQPDPGVLDTVDVQVIDVTSPDMKIVTLHMRNETKCVYKCVANATVCTENEVWDEDICACECRYQKDIPPPPPDCPTGQHWEYSHCACVEDWLLSGNNGTISDDPELKLKASVKNETRSKIINITVKENHVVP